MEELHITKFSTADQSICIKLSFVLFCFCFYFFGHTSRMGSDLYFIVDATMWVKSAVYLRRWIESTKCFKQLKQSLLFFPK